MSRLTTPPASRRRSPARWSPFGSLAAAAAGLLLGGCASVFSPCTPDTCAAVATEPVTTGAFGSWTGDDGRELSVVRVVRSVDEAAARSTAAGVSFPDGSLGLLVQSGEWLLAEWPVSQPHRVTLVADRQYARVRIDGDAMHWEPLVVAPPSADATPVDRFAAFSARLPDDAAWGPATDYVRRR